MRIDVRVGRHLHGRQWDKKSTCKRNSRRAPAHHQPRDPERRARSVMEQGGFAEEKPERHEGKPRDQPSRAPPPERRDVAHPVLRIDTVHA